MPLQSYINAPVLALTPKQNAQLNDDVWVKDEQGDAVHGVVTQLDPLTGEYMVQTDKAVNGKKVQPFVAGELYEKAGADGDSSGEDAGTGTAPLLQAGENTDTSETSADADRDGETGARPARGTATTPDVDSLRTYERTSLQSGVGTDGDGSHQGQVNGMAIPEDKRRILSEKEIDSVVDDLEEHASEQTVVPYSKEEWNKRFSKPIDTPIGKVRMGPHQFGKLHPDGNNQHQDRRGWIGLIYDTLKNPSLIVEQDAPEEGAERAYKYVFVKSFTNKSGETMTYFTSVSVKKGGMDVVITNHFKKYKDIKNLLRKGKLCFPSISPGGIQTEMNQPSSSVTTSGTDVNAGVPAAKIGNSSESGDKKSEKISAIDRIPSDEVTDKKGNTRTVHHWEEADPGDTWDALSEQYGDEQLTRHKVGIRVKKLDGKIKALDKQIKKLDDSDDFDADINGADGYKSLLAQKKDLAAQKKYWQQVLGVPERRRQAEADAAEKVRHEGEQLTGVPDVVNDKPGDARQRGYRNVNGVVVERQQKTDGVSGRESNVKFSSKDTVKGHLKVIEADDLQPSHVRGQRNPQFFIDEAQPKDRTDAASSMAAAKIAANMNPEEITGDGSAYQFSAPTVNSRGEVIQGNNRSDALKLMWSSPAYAQSQAAYKQYLIDHAEEFGFTPEDVEKIQQMKHPVMVNEVDVTDDDAIRLGQMKAGDNESGGVERIDPVTTSQKLGHKVGSFANVLLSSADEDASLSDVLSENGGKAVHWLRTQGVISDTAEQSAFDKKGNLTPEAKQDLQNILKQSLFQGGVSDLPTMFEKMPAKAQKAVLSTFMRDFDSAESERILPEIQKAIEAWYDCAMSNDAFAKAGNYKSAKWAMRDWTLQTNMLDDSMPSDKFSNFAMELACRLQGCSMRETQQNLNDFFDLVQGKSQGDLFGGTTMGEQADRQEAIRRVFDIDYKPIKNKENGKTGSDAVADNGSQGGEGRQGSQGNGGDRERAESGGGSADGGGRAEKHDEEGEEIIEPKPVGHGRFGDIYSNFKGSFKDAVSWRSLNLPFLGHASASQNMVLRRYIFSISFVPLHHEAERSSKQV